MSIITSVIFSAWGLKDIKFFLNFSSSSISTKNEVSSCKPLNFVIFISTYRNYKAQQKRLQKTRSWWITYCGKGRLKSVIGFGLLSVKEWVTKCDMDCKVRDDYKKRHIYIYIYIYIMYIIYI